MRYTIPQRVIVEADEERRKAERQARMSRSIDDKAQLIIKRIRLGEIRTPTVQTLAALGDPEYAEVANLLGLDRIENILNRHTAEVDLDRSLVLSGLSASQMIEFAAECVEAAILRGADSARGRTFYLTNLHAATSKESGALEEISEYLRFFNFEEGAEGAEGGAPTDLDYAVRHLFEARVAEATNDMSECIRLVAQAVRAANAIPPVDHNFVRNTLIKHVKESIE